MLTGDHAPNALLCPAADTAAFVFNRVMLVLLAAKHNP